MILSTNSYYVWYSVWFSQPIAIICGTVYDSLNQYLLYAVLCMIISTNSYYVQYSLWFSQPIAIIYGTMYDSHNQ